MTEGKNEQQLVKLLQKGNVEAFDSLLGSVRLTPNHSLTA
jgi:hypothetical protein